MRLAEWDTSIELMSLSLFRSLRVIFSLDNSEDWLGSIEVRERKILKMSVEDFIYLFISLMIIISKSFNHGKHKDRT